MKKNRRSSQQHVVLSLHLPLSFIYLCEVLNVSPEQIITDFITHMSLGTWKNEDSYRKRELLIEYLVAMNYKSSFSEASLRKMLSELSIFTHIDLTHASATFLHTHESWHSEYLAHWLKRWKAAADQTPAHSPA